MHSPIDSALLRRLITRHRGLPTDPSVDVDSADRDAGDEVAAVVPGRVAV